MKLTDGADSCLPAIDAFCCLLVSKKDLARSSALQRLIKSCWALDWLKLSSHQRRRAPKAIDSVTLSAIEATSNNVDLASIFFQRCPSTASLPL